MHTTAAIQPFCTVQDKRGRFRKTENVIYNILSREPAGLLYESDPTVYVVQNKRNGISSVICQICYFLASLSVTTFIVYIKH